MTKKLWKGKRTLRENLQARLPLLVAKYFGAGRSALAPGTSWKQMHRFRLATKRFRYTLELFEDAYGPGLAPRIAHLRSMQTMLGDINDLAVTAGMLEDLPDTADIRDTLMRRIANKTSKLRVFWQTRIDAPGEQERWMRYVGRYACRPHPAVRPKLLPDAPEIAPNP